MLVARGWVEEEKRSYCVMEMKFQYGKREKFWGCRVTDSHTTMLMY